MFIISTLKFKYVKFYEKAASKCGCHDFIIE